MNTNEIEAKIGASILTMKADETNLQVGASTLKITDPEWLATARHYRWRRV